MHAPPNIEAPVLQPPLPDYPDLPQIVMVTGNSIGNNVYPAKVQQYSGSLTLRSRETCYVWEPNSIALSVNAYYDCRLIGSHLGLPLFAASCCVTGTVPSSSASA